MASKEREQRKNGVHRRRGSRGMGFIGEERGRKRKERVRNERRNEKEGVEEKETGEKAMRLAYFACMRGRH